MNHKWTKAKDFKPHDGFYQKHVCDRCGCIKTKHMMKIRRVKIYDECFERSGMLLGFRSALRRSIECLDWDDNTLD